jgi:hypothetical protein
MSRHINSFKKSLFLPIILPLLSIVLGFVILAPRNNLSLPSQSLKEPLSEEVRNPRVVIQSLSNAPIIIRSASVDTADPNTPSISIKLVNTGKSLIGAFTIQCDTSFGESKLTTWSLNNIRSYEKAFKLQETRTVTINDATYSQAPQYIELSVDFVEFVDGTRWGADNYRSGERLNVFRAGVHAESKYVLNKIKIQGLKATIQNIRDNSSDIEYPTQSSSEYLEGFRMGIETVHNSILHLMSRNMLNEVVNELQRPVDLSDWR